jgi:hypothetical protein
MLANKRYYIKESNKLFSSASLTFYHKTLGYLICNEYRKTEQVNLYHVIGGKTEESDVDILYTAIREFVEETKIYINKCVCSDENILNLTNNLYIIIKPHVTSFDLCVNPDKNLYHRYYLCNVNIFKKDTYNLRGEIIGLYRFYNMLKNTKHSCISNKDINNLQWVNDNSYNSNYSSMLNTFYSNINNFN